MELSTKSGGIDSASSGSIGSRRASNSSGDARDHHSKS